MGGNLYALNVPYTSREAMYATFLSNPELFTKTNPGNALRRELAARKDIKETVMAGYLMGYFKPHPQVDVAAGLRYETTDQQSNMVVPVTAAQMRAAGWGDASSENIEYIKMQYRNGERTKTTNTYDYLLPSAFIKYKYDANLQMLLNYYETYQRVDVQKIAGSWRINDTDLTATVPNPRLTPDKFNTILAKVEYYFEPAGVFSVTYTNRAWNGPPDEERDLTEPEIADLVDIYGEDMINSLEGYTIRGYGDNKSESRRLQTLEFEYRQRIPFVKGLMIVGSFTRITPSWRSTGSYPKLATGSIRYSYKRLSTNINGTWQDRRLTDTGANRYLYARFVMNLDINYKFSKQANLFIAVRNLLNEARAWYDNSPQYLYQHEQFGTNITVGVSGNF